MPGAARKKNVYNYAEQNDAVLRAADEAMGGRLLEVGTSPPVHLSYTLPVVRLSYTLMRLLVRPSAGHV